MLTELRHWLTPSPRIDFCKHAVVCPWPFEYAATRFSRRVTARPATEAGWGAIRVKSTWPRDFNASRRAWSYHRRMARIVWQLVGVLLLIGFVGAYFWPIPLPLAAAYLSPRLLLHT